MSAETQTETTRGTHGNCRHGMRTTEYTIWVSMRARCEQPGSSSYRRYGGRGITVCERWRDFATFLSDMGERPAGKSIDRIDGSGNYEPGNCRWATPKEQSRNQRSNKLVEYRGERRCLAAWAEMTGVPYDTLKSRLLRGMSAEEAFTKTTDRKSMLRHYDHKGKSLTASGWAAETGIKLSVLVNRLRRGWTVGRSLTKGVNRG